MCVLPCSIHSVYIVVWDPLLNRPSVLHSSQRKGKENFLLRSFPEIARAISNYIPLVRISQLCSTRDTGKCGRYSRARLFFFFDKRIFYLFSFQCDNLAWESQRQMEQSQKGSLTPEESIKIALPHCLPQPEHDTLGRSSPTLLVTQFVIACLPTLPRGRRPKAFGWRFSACKRNPTGGALNKDVHRNQNETEEIRDRLLLSALGISSPVSIFWCVVCLCVALCLAHYLPRDFPLCA